jgi:SAM-dependent methyltransferase
MSAKMTYPTAKPNLKHDLQCAQSLPPDDSSLLAEIGFSNSSDIFRTLEEEVTANPTTICSVYSYADGPDYPGAIARGLVVLGVADLSLSLVRKIVSDEEVPDCIHKCTLAVQLADSKHLQSLDPRHQKNSSAFAKFMKQLRKEELVAILGKDKHGRFGILVPMGEARDSDSSEITSDDCAAFCFIGDIKEVMDLLTNRTTSAVELAPSDNARSGLWEPPAAEESSASTGLWKPPGRDEEETDAGNNFSAPWETNQAEPTAPWETNGTVSRDKRSFDDMNEMAGDQKDDSNDGFHADSTAAAADAFYSGLTRSLSTRADSYLFHMRAFNGWVKATQIQELDPRTTTKGKPMRKKPLRVLDLACGKGGDLTKWTLHERGMSKYVGIDVARGSLRDAAIRARELRKRKKLSSAVFTCADLGDDVPGRKKSLGHKNMQKLSTWSLEEESEYETGTPEFKMIRGGGISEKDLFDVVSIQFAIHYMMSSRKRARRFFHTVSELLEIGGNLICTTIDARVVLDHLMNLGLDYHFDDDGSEPGCTEAVVEAGAGACKIKFEPSTVKKILSTKSDGSKAEEDLFGLQYTFTLVEGSDHAAGVGNAVNLPEWLTPLPVLEALGREAGLELDYAQNFHEFYETRKDPSAYPSAHHALYNMKVLNRDGSISMDEWSVSRLYAAIQFRKVRESSVKIPDEDEDEEELSESEDEKDSPVVELDPVKAKKMLPMAMIRAKRAAGEEKWNTLSSDEKKRLTQLELETIAGK